MENRPNGRKTNITGTGTGLGRKGSGIGGGPAGRPGGYSGRTGGSSGGGSSSGGGPTRAGGGNGKLIGILVLVALLVFGGGGGLLGGLFGGGNSGSDQQSGLGGLLSHVVPSLGDLSNGIFGGGSSATSDKWDQSSNVKQLDTSVESGSRAKRTEILGNGRDKVTLMVYMCGTDLESKHGMASADIDEMRRASLSDNVRILIYTGGCSSWKNSDISSKYNQIHTIENGRLKTLVSNDGNGSMTDPSTLTRFIIYCKSYYEANRNFLVLWDHGGGSITGFGYDEKNKSSASMTLKGINEALTKAGVKFDFVGYDACLMATLENALMLDSHSDYLIASEETEPGIGWYYTNWLEKLSENTSMPTVELGKIIVDDFVSECDRKCSGQKTTLSVVDLAELAHTVPGFFKDFASSTSQLISGSEFKKVSDARAASREFSPSSKIDQVDLVDFAGRIGTSESKDLINAIRGAVKYNNTSSSISNAYGLSIYFPYKKTSKVGSAVATYEAIGLDDEYSRCIQSFASMETGGQAAGGDSSGFGSILGQLTGQTTSSDGLSSLFGNLLGGSSPLGGLFGKTIDMEDQTDYISDNMIDASHLVWNGSDENATLRLTEKEWGLVHDLLLNVFYDDGEGYIDLGLDNVFSFDKNGDLKGTYDKSWVAVDNNIVAYYYVDSLYGSDGSYTVTGRVPVLIDGVRSELIVIFDDKHENGYIAGARQVYSGETDTVAKGVTEIKEGAVLQFICDYYDYDGNYMDTYELESRVVYNGKNVVSNVYIPDPEYASPMYVFTDIYEKEYWTPVLPGFEK